VVQHCQYMLQVRVEGRGVWWEGREAKFGSRHSQGCDDELTPSWHLVEKVRGGKFRNDWLQ
jgi:hypothetical protein